MSNDIIGNQRFVRRMGVCRSTSSGTQQLAGNGNDSLHIEGTWLGQQLSVKIIP